MHLRVRSLYSLEAGRAQMLLKIKSFLTRSLKAGVLSRQIDLKMFHHSSLHSTGTTMRQFLLASGLSLLCAAGGLAQNQTVPVQPIPPEIIRMQPLPLLPGNSTSLSRLEEELETLEAHRDV